MLQHHEEPKCSECHKTSLQLAKDGKVLKTCSGCKLAQYCSIECQKKNRKKHKLTCIKIMDILEQRHELSKERKCANCKKTSTQLKRENSTLAKCSVCETAQYCCKQCQKDNHKEHKDLCTKYQKMPQLNPKDYVKTGKRRLTIEGDFFAKWLRNCFVELQLCIQSENLEELSNLLHRTEGMICLAWGMTAPYIRYVIPPLLLHLGRDEEAFDCIYYLIFEYGKDNGRSLKLDKENPNFVQSMKRRSKFKDILNEPELKGEYAETLFGPTNPHIYCGSLFLTYIGIKLNIIKDLQAREDNGETDLHDFTQDQTLHLMNMVMHMLVMYEWDDCLELLVNNKPIEPDIHIPASQKEEIESVMEDLNIFAQIPRMKIMSDPWCAAKIEQIYDHLRSNSVVQDKFNMMSLKQ